MSGRPPRPGVSRRTFLKTAGAGAAVTGLAGLRGGRPAAAGPGAGCGPHHAARGAGDADAPLVYTLAELPTGASDATKALPRRGNVLGPRVPRNGTRGDVDKGFAEAEVA